MRRRSFVVVLGGALAGCGRGAWFGEREDPPLEGRRIPVLLAGQGTAADPRLAELQVRLPPPVLNPDWPLYGGEVGNAPGHPAGPATATLAWRVSIGTGAGGSARLLGPPVVAGGVVYAVDGAATVAAIAAGDGRRLWTWRSRESRLDDRVSGGAVGFADGVLYATLAHGEVVALPAGGGDPIWRVSLRAPLRTAPTVARGIVLVRTADNQLVALDAATGQLRWRHAGTVETAALLGGAPPAVRGGTVVVAYASGEVAALALDTGRPLWTDVVARPRRTLALGTILDITGAPVIDRDRVIVAGNGGETVAFDTSRGERIWELPVGSSNTPWVAGEFIFLLSEQGELLCLLRQGGRVRWVSRLDGEAAAGGARERLVWAGPTLAGGQLWLAGSNGELVSVAPESGAVTSRTRLGSRASQPPIAAGGTLYLLTDSAELFAFR
ncbi:MAG: hypothetical protein KatS3mg117_0850 [Geminicoccaceae bacterium]|nr:MAG: hypothetical protein KatS3mg117_0850 [Geminicoccaceae bacterium]